MTAPQIPKALQFAPPPQGNPQTWDYAVAEGLKFPERFVQKAKEVAQMRVQNGQLQEKLGYFVRNLIAVVDNCEEALAAADVAKPSAASPSEPEATDEGNSADASDAQSPPTAPDQLSDPQQLALASLASVHRSVISLLENMGVVQVDLMGKNYENVTFEGTPIPGPGSSAGRRDPQVARGGCGAAALGAARRRQGKDRALRQSLLLAYQKLPIWELKVCRN